MTISLKHKFASAKSDTADPTLIQPSNWNDEHDITCASNKVLGRASAGTGTVEELTCTELAQQLLAAVAAEDIVSLLNLETRASGEIAAFAMTTAPTNWLVCDGRAISRTTYADLFAAIGTAWGSGDGSTTFNIPDFRGAFLRGFDNGRGYDSGRAFASYQADNYPEHSHDITDPGHTHSYTAGGADTGWVGNGGTAIPVQVSTPASATSGSSNTGITATELGGGTASETRPKNYAVQWCIHI